MWLIRKISPWADQSKFYKKGNPSVKLIQDIYEAKKAKDELELKALKENYVSNNYEYWDVVCDKELIDLDDFVFKNYGFNVLVKDYNRGEELRIDDVISKHFPEHLSDKDILDIQNFIGRYHYSIQKVTEQNKYIVLFNSEKIEHFQDESIASTHEFKYYNTEKEALESVAKKEHWSIVNSDKEGNGESFTIVKT